MLFLISFIFIVFLPCSTDSSKNGAIVTLVKGSTHGDFYLLVRRNKSILQFMWDFSNTTSKSIQINPDIVLFHESFLSTDMMHYIQEQTPNLPIRFILVTFEGFAMHSNTSDISSPFAQKYDKCHPTGWSGSFNNGYKNMCRFWFIGFLSYVKEYDWILRLDPDCELEEESRGVLPLSDNSVFISSPAWLPLHKQRFDRVSTTSDGEVVKGMGPFVRDFWAKLGVQEMGLPPRIFDSWHAPYTNAMYMNLHFLRKSDEKSENSQNYSNTSRVVWEFLSAVNESNCIYSNRWGDMPLWGAALALLDHSVHFLPLSYYHWSHKTVVTSTAKSGFFRKDIPVMLVFADNMHRNSNASESGGKNNNSNEIKVRIVS